MPSTLAPVERDVRTGLRDRVLAGHAAGAIILQLALAEEIDPALVRRVLRAAGITPGPVHPPIAKPYLGRLADPTWLAAEYATKSANRIAEELGCSRERVSGALRAAGIPKHGPGIYRSPRKEITPEIAERIVSRYLAGSPAERVADEFGLPVKAVNRLVEERTLSA